MNHEMLNNRISQLPIAMAGIVHAFPYNGRSLSNFNHTVVSIARRRLP
ncbi:RAxF-45 family protein [Paenibacillus polymyxa]|nr:RAxF-45 family protein [Paenibacillus polymyxa]WPQ56677.1 RAxF-45 family protein [Paenibacillus polymyxa]